MRLLALFLAAGVVAAACGTDDEEGGGGGQAADAEGGANEGNIADAGEPQYGGRVIYGLEAETSQPWTPQESLCAISCHMVMRSVFDPLALINEDGDIVANLAESIEPNEDFTQWTITPRQGITFHDGTPFDANAIVTNITDHLDSILTGTVMQDVEGVALSPDGASAVVTMKRPWTHFDLYLTGLIGYMASPKWLADVKAGAAQSTEPVGTGPFVFKEYVAGDHFTATRNENYWREDADGNKLPFLDEIEYRVLEDIKSRSNALEAGDIDIIHTSNGEEIAKFRENDQFQRLELDEFGETNYILLHVTREDSPLKDVEVRRALALAYDAETANEQRGASVMRIANGPFSPTQIGYLEDTGFPSYDLDEAKRVVEEYEAENGPIEFNFSTTTDEFNLVSNQLVQSMWKAAGIDVELAQVEQGQYILKAALGDFEAFAWRNHGGPDPDGQYIWWHSSTALPPGQIAVNFGRIRDDVIDENLDLIRTSSDDEERRTAAEEINRRFGEQVYNIWASWTVWAIVFSQQVHGVDDFTLPDGSPDASGAGISGTHQVMQIWVDQ